MPCAPLHERSTDLSTSYPRLNFAPYCQMTNDNLMELIDLVPEDQLDWSPA